jgi:hypothetical protein
VAGPALEQGITSHRRLAMLLGEATAGAVPLDERDWKFAGARSALSDCTRMSAGWVDVVAEGVRSAAALLPIAELQHFAAAVRASKCLAALSARERLRLDFYLAAGESDFNTMARTGAELLGRPEAMTPDEASSVVGTAMTALVVTGRATQALELLQTHRGRLPTTGLSLTLRLAVGHAVRAAGAGGR